MPNDPALTPLTDMFAEPEFAAFISTHGRSRTVSPTNEILSERALSVADVQYANAHTEAGEVLGVQPHSIKAIRHTHHRLAQLLAVGTDETVAARLCNYNPQRVTQLKSDPAFAELLAYYSKNVETQWADFVSVAANLSMDFLQELQKRLDENPETLSPGMLIESVKLLADRSGHAPVQKSLNVNVHAGLGDRIRSARERAAQDYAQSLIEGSAHDAS